MKLDVTIKESRDKIDLFFKEINVVSDGGFELGYAQGKAQGEVDGYIKGSSDGHQLGLLEGFENAKLKTEEISVLENGTYEPAGDNIGFNKVNVNVIAKSKLSVVVSDNETYDIIEADLSGVTRIADKAFAEKKNLKSLTIPASVQSMGTYILQNSNCENLIINATNATSSNSFYGAKIKSLVSCNNVGSSDFYNCTSLETIELKEPCKTIGSDCFRGCSLLHSVILPNTLTSIGSSFSYCTALTEVEIPENITTVSNYAFQNDYNLKHIYFNAKKVYSDSSTSSAMQSNNNTRFGTNSLTNAENATTVFHVGSLVEIIPSYFCLGYHNYSTSTKYYSYIHELVFEENSVCKEIGNYCFYSNRWIANITFPASITKIGSYAFNSCSALTTIKMLSTTPPSIQSNTFSTTYLTKIIVPQGSLSKYQSATNWSVLAGIMEEATE